MTENSETGALTAKEFQARYRIGRSTFYKEIADGKLHAKKCRGKTLILNRDALEWEAALLGIKPQEPGA